jgi:DNA-binding CsgD family transcriptional regulator/HD-like signal output (HDOD) protein
VARPGRQHERRLLAAFDALDGFPCVEASRDRALAALDASPVDRAALTAVIESDLALTARVLRQARRFSSRPRALVGTVPEAVDLIDAPALRDLIAATPTVDFFARSGGWGGEPVAYRRHVTAVQAALRRIAHRCGTDDLDRLLAAATLHDIGKLVLVHAHAGHLERPVPEQGTPEQRLVEERRATGIDHALVGGVLVRRWGLSPSLARLVECHHAEDPAHDADAIARLRLADMVARHGHGDAVAPPRIAALARRVGLDRTQLRDLLHEQDGQVPLPPRDALPNPLSLRETEVLRHLAQGLVYKQIAGRLDLATSTVRTHLHNIYLKLGAVDRAQAVLIAVRSGWI